MDAIEFDNVDAYQNKTGLTISAATQEQFDAAIATLAHAAGFAVGLKNDLGQANDLQPYFDFAISEQCWQYRECNFPAPGLQANGIRQGRLQRRIQAGDVEILPPRRTQPAITSIPSSRTSTSTTSPTLPAADIPAPDHPRRTRR